MTVKETKIYMRAYYLKNKKKILAQAKVNFEKNKVRIRAKRYGISLKEYDRFLIVQKNRCVICRKIFRQTPHIDHCHKTDKVRGLLCRDCNTGLGRFADSISSLQNAIEYLKRTV